MHPKINILIATLATWIFAAVSCTTLTFLRQVYEFGEFWALFVALITGLAVSFALTSLIRRMCLDTPRTNEWASLGTREAALLGVVSWGLPLGLLFTLNQGLNASGSLMLLIFAVYWPLLGLAFGIMMRWTSVRRAYETKPSRS